MLSRSFKGVMIGSVLIGTLGTFGAAMIALVHPFSSFPTGPIVVIILFGFFAVVWAFRHFIKPKAVEEDVAVPHAHSHEKAPGSFGHGHSH
jgi:ABC-type Mn2+/Zn2+ transport system permease subunit